MSSTEHLDLPIQETVEVRRNAGLAALVGALASAVAIAWLGRAAQSGALLDWLVVGAMALLAGGWLYSFVDARTPLLVADGHGVRVRLGRAWQGLPWQALAGVQHTPRASWWRDGRLVLEPVDGEHVLGEAEPSVRRRAWLNTRMHGAPMAVPLGMATRVVGASDADLTVALRRLAQGATAITEPVSNTSVAASNRDSVAASDRDSVVASNRDSVAVGYVGPFGDEPAASESLTQTSLTEVADTEALLVGAPGAPASDADSQRGESAVQGIAMRARRGIARLVELRRPTSVPPDVVSSQTTTAEATTGTTTDTGMLDADLPDPHADAPHAEDPQTVAGVEPVRPLLAARRSEVRQQLPEADLEPLRGRELRRDGRVSLIEESAPDDAAFDAPMPVEFEEQEQAPRPDPVIGPLLASARERIGLSVDALAERTRIRPHVIEAIEVDDFGPCGGDFYARGHLRTLARILGLDPGALIKTYDERYADAPINARKVFEAELATGTGGIRAMRGGPNWSIVVAAVMAVVLAWSVAKLVMDDSPEPEGVMSLSQGSGGPHGAVQETRRVTVKLTAIGPSEVEVRNARGKVIFAETLETGDIHRLDVVAPAKVHASDAGAVQVEIDNVPQGTVGESGRAGSRKFAR